MVLESYVLIYNLKYQCFFQASNVNALRRLGQKEPEALPEQLAAFGIGERPKTGWRELWSSHPPLEDRIKALEKRASKA